MSGRISVGHLAYLSVMLRHGHSNPAECGECLDSHFIRNYRAYRDMLLRALRAAEDGAFVVRDATTSPRDEEHARLDEGQECVDAQGVPRRIGKSVKRLASQLQAHFGEVSGWKDVHWTVLAYLLVFSRQQLRVEAREGRWIHVEVHALALHYASAFGETSKRVLQSFLLPEEISQISRARDVLDGGARFSDAAQELCSRGMRETVRAILEVDERLSGIPAPTPETLRLRAKEEAERWRAEDDPQASRVRIKGVVHEARVRELLFEAMPSKAARVAASGALSELRKEQKSVLSQLAKMSRLQQQTLAALQSQQKKTARLEAELLEARREISELRVQGKSSESPNRVGVPVQVARTSAPVRRKQIPRVDISGLFSSLRFELPSVSGEIAEIGLVVCTLVTFLFGLFLIPQSLQSEGIWLIDKIAWWWFVLGGALITLGRMVVVPLISRILGDYDDGEITIDVWFLVGTTTIFLLLLKFVGQDTYVWGIALWHLILGLCVLGIPSSLVWPHIQALLRRVSVHYSL